MVGRSWEMLEQSKRKAAVLVDTTLRPLGKNGTSHSDCAMQSAVQAGRF